MTEPAPTVAVFTKNRINPAYHGARLAADRVAARFGGRAVHYVPETPDDPDQQSALVDQALATRPDAIAFVPAHPTAVDDAVCKINRANIPIVNLINRLTAGDYVSFVGSDDHALARQVATRLFDALGGRGTVAILEGPPGVVTGAARLRGFRDAATRYPEIRIAGSANGAFLREPGRQATADLLATTPRLDGILAANDMMALGALDALAAAGRTSLVVGVNALPEAIDAIKRGTLLATADFDAFKLAAVATEAAFRHLRGEPVPREILLPVQVVDRSNCAAWDKPIEAREGPRWKDVVG
ncbi:MAG: sugar ABC transporter substrate-binding protein [Proteobacteria bacterium]|nr:sugar ABC transporter substrate-binding protein [Pseudomonadota bacterium]